VPTPPFTVRTDRAHSVPDVIATVEIYQDDMSVQPSDARQVLTRIAHSILAT
jgi:hypothetical protein